MSAFSPRPVKQPWTAKSSTRSLKIFLASLIPLLVAVGSWLILGIDYTVALVGIFLPLQILSAGIVGFNAFGRRGFKDALLLVLTIFLSTTVLVLLSSVLISVILKGWHALSGQFILENNIYVSTTTSLDYGGVGHAILGSLIVVAITTVLAVPLGISIAVFLTQSQSKLRGPVRTFTQAISGLPSVVSGLFILSLMPYLHLEHVGFAGSLALFPLMLPTMARVSEEALRLVPNDLRMAALALGAPNYKAFFKVILPAAKTGIITALLLGLARVIGETAPLVLTLSPNNGTNLNPFYEGMASLPRYIYSFVNTKYPTSQERAWGAALVLVMVVALLFASARILGRKKKLKTKTVKKNTNKKDA
jgi:phosphate transport system permease protein